MTREQLIKALREADPEDLLNGTLLEEAADMLEADGVPVNPGTVVELAKLHGTRYVNRHYPEKPTYGFTSEGLISFAKAIAAAPQPAIQERKPLTDGQIRNASLQAGMQEHYMGFHSGFIRFARAIEAAHGITENKQ